MNFDKIFLADKKGKEKTASIINGVMELLNLSQKSKEENPNCKNFKKFRELYSMTFFDESDTSLPKWKSRFKDNQVFKIIETIKPFILDGSPKFIAKPLSESAVARCGIINEVFDYIVENPKTNYKKMRRNLLHDGLVLGTGICKVIMTDRLDPTGEVFFTTVPPECFFPDPDGDSVMNCRYIIERTFEDLDTLKVRFPSKAKDIEGLEKTGSKVYSGGNGGRALFGVSSDYTLGEEVDENKFYNKVELLYCYIKDTSVIKNGDAYEPKYPDGRLIITAGDSVLLYDGETPHGVPFPFEEYRPYDLPVQESLNTFWGISEVSSIFITAVESTKTYRRISNILYQHAYPRVRIDKRSGLDPKNIPTDPTQPIMAGQGEVELMAPHQQLTPELIMWVNYLKGNIEDVTGQHPAAQGAEPKQAKSGIAIQALQTFAVKRDKLKAENFYDCLGRIGRLALKMAQKFYPERKTISILKNEPEKQFQFRLVNDPIHPETNIREVEFDLLVSVDSNLFSTRETKLSEAMQLYQLGIYSPEIVLSKIDDPDAQKVLEKLRMAQYKQAMTEMLMGGNTQTNVNGSKFGMAKDGTSLIQDRPM